MSVLAVHRSDPAFGAYDTQKKREEDATLGARSVAYVWATAAAAVGDLLCLDPAAGSIPAASTGYTTGAVVEPHNAGVNDAMACCVAVEAITAAGYVKVVAGGPVSAKIIAATAAELSLVPSGTSLTLRAATAITDEAFATSLTAEAAGVATVSIIDRNLIQ